MSSLDSFVRSVDPDVCEELRSGPIDASTYFASRDAGSSLPDKLAVGHDHRRRLRRFAIAQHNQGDVFIDLDRSTAHKRVTTLKPFGTVDREIGWLTALGESGRTPAVVSATADVIVTTYAGEPLRQHNLPPDWRDQAEEILSVLEAAGCRHNDIKCDNLVVSEGRMSLIDFGWATAILEPVPAEWPEAIGRQHRLDVQVFDDRHAMFEACASAEDGRIDASRPVGQGR